MEPTAGMSPTHHHDPSQMAHSATGFFSNLLEVFTPRQQCMNYEPDVIWLHIVSDSLIALAYYSIPIALVYFVRRRKDLEFNWMFLLFAAFILACGTTHIFGVWAIWQPLYRIDGLVKLATALVSIVTAILLWPLIPRALALPSPAQLRSANESLQVEIGERQRAQSELQQARDELEVRVQERTSELAEANRQLESEIGERRRAEAALAQHAQHLAQSNIELERFAYIASHDLQEPLRTVTSFAQLLSRRYKDRLDADADEMIGFVVEGATRMKQLINDLLAYGRVSSQATPAAGPTDLSAALQSALTNLESAVGESGAQVRADPLPVVYADAAMMTQLFQNLVGNAIKFREPGRACEISITAEQRELEWVVAVRDNGVGIEARHFERVFQVFQRLHRSDYPGTGIGLAICKRIVERQGGRIWVESEPGVGTTFKFTIPSGNQAGEPATGKG